MSNKFTLDQIDKLLKKVQVEYESNSYSADFEIFATSDEEFEVIGSLRDPQDLKKILAVNKQVRKSGVVNHYVFDKTVGGFVCAGLTFPNGRYIHLNPNIPKESVLMLTESSST